LFPCRHTARRVCRPGVFERSQYALIGGYIPTQFCLAFRGAVLNSLSFSTSRLEKLLVARPAPLTCTTAACVSIVLSPRCHPPAFLPFFLPRCLCLLAVLRTCWWEVVAAAAACCQCHVSGPRSLPAYIFECMHSTPDCICYGAAMTQWQIAPSTVKLPYKYIFT
jgi:hypothetical protein